MVQNRTTHAEKITVWRCYSLFTSQPQIHIHNTCIIYFCLIFNEQHECNNSNTDDNLILQEQSSQFNI